MANSSPEQPKELEIVEEHWSERSSSGRRFPLAFHDFATGALMKNPVVNANGDSHELSTFKSQPNETYYPNRALKAIIQEEEKLAEQTLAGSARRLDHQLKAGFGCVSGKSLFGGPYQPLPESLYCPITCDLMKDPCITKEGITYERQAIVKWIQLNGTSPMTRIKLSLDDLRDNNAIYDLLQEEKGQNSEEMHPSIRRWKEELTICQTQQHSQRLEPDVEVPAAQPDVAPAPAATSIPVAGDLPIQPNDEDEEVVSDCTAILIMLLYLALFIVAIAACIALFILLLPYHFCRAILETCFNDGENEDGAP